MWKSLSYTVLTSMVSLKSPLLALLLSTPPILKVVGLESLSLSLSLWQYEKRRIKQNNMQTNSFRRFDMFVNFTKMLCTPWKPANI